MESQEWQAEGPRHEHPASFERINYRTIEISNDGILMCRGF